MTRIVRWNPAVRRPIDLFNEFDRMFARPTAPYRTAENWGLALDVIENEVATPSKLPFPASTLMIWKSPSKTMC
jgi:hypothetical protein